MIVAVDDQSEVLDMITEILNPAGYAVQTFNSAPPALEFLAENAPSLILSDILMPEMDGFAFREAYCQAHPLRLTPFLFLSSQNEPDTIVRGLDAGADDFLVKPVHPQILRAKVRSILEKRKTPDNPTFHGDLGRFPLVKIMQFCEAKGLTGTVEIPVGNQVARLRMTGGQVDLNGTPEENNILDQLYEMVEGTFRIIPEQIDFSSIADVAVTQPAPQEDPLEKPMGKLSGIQINKRLIQIQTEFVTYPENQILSVAILDGKVLMKKGLPTRERDRIKLAALIEKQHTIIEEEVRRKTADLMRSKAPAEAPPAPEKSLNHLIEEGFEKYRGRDYAGALKCWEKAIAIDPESKTLRTNLAIVRRKIDQS
ncbi:MAG: response regulator transcription factor [Desulfuromonadales bacterium]